MAQEFHVLRCYSCQTFQVHQVKKSKKWNCKMCGEKQSISKVFGQGSGVDCRRHVQKLNSLRGELHEAETEHVWLSCKQEGEEEEEIQDQCLIRDNQQCAEGAVNRWSRYLDKTAEEAAAEEVEEEESVYTDRNAVRNVQPGNNRNTRKRKRSWGFAAGSVRHDADHSGAEDPWNRTKQRGHPEEKRDSHSSSWVPLNVSHDASVTNRPPAAAKASTLSGASGPETEFNGSKWSKFLSVHCDEGEEDEEERPQRDPRTGTTRAGDGEPLCFPPVLNAGRSENQGRFKSREVAGFTDIVFVEKSARSPTGVIDSLPFSPGYHAVQKAAAYADRHRDLKSEHLAGRAPVWPQTPPISKLHPSLHSLFQTNEDFDDF
ncbi:hypothetical protein AAFF_G00322910 [Aldrovandia affinis]|uniref:MRN complex-interacting protein N-terminal domain-containing protein n=1 Tax=Aldrovandia affinis TaxID=143900 RepID=A0AAD7WQH6_9TELE|nr:hypothetical protein AAFF_G00322910 [Aldrovandia affinis]